MEKRYFSAPTTVNLELTELCNVKCRHCYNPWRDETMGEISLSEIKLNLLIKKLSDAKVFHVILTGGEPMSNFDVLVKAITKLTFLVQLICRTRLTGFLIKLMKPVLVH